MHPLHKNDGTAFIADRIIHAVVFGVDDFFRSLFLRRLHIRELKLFAGSGRIQDRQRLLHGQRTTSGGEVFLEEFGQML